MEPCNSLDQVLQHIDASTLQGYRKFMHDVLIEGISHHNLNFDTLNQQLMTLNKEVYDDLCEKAIVYYDMHATAEIKSFGN